MSEESVMLCFLVTFHIIISYIEISYPKISLKLIKSLKRYKFLLLQF